MEQDFSTRAVLLRGLIGEIKHPLLVALFCHLVWPLYSFCAEYWLQKGWDERLFFVCGTVLIHGVLYVSSALFFLACDYSEYMQRHKLVRTEEMRKRNEGLVVRTLLEAPFSQLVAGPPALYFVYGVFKLCGSPSIGASLPPFHILYIQFLVANILNGWLFYFAHRLLHHELIYAYIHKQHHTYKAPISIAAEHAHFIEHALANQLPTVAGCMFGGFHFAVWFVWLAVRLQETYEGHSGYSFYGSTLHKLGFTHGTHACYHDFHHTRNAGNYGGPEYLDFIFGTNKQWIALGGTEKYIALKHAQNRAKGE